MGSAFGNGCLNHQTPAPSVGRPGTDIFRWTPLEEEEQELIASNTHMIRGFTGLLEKLAIFLRNG